MGTRQQARLHAVLLLVALEEQPQLVVADLADETRRHPEDGRAADCVGGGAAGHVFHAQGLEGLPDAVARFHIDVLHAPFREVVGVEERIIRQDGQDVGECVSDSEN